MTKPTLPEVTITATVATTIRNTARREFEVRKPGTIGWSVVPGSTAEIVEKYSGWEVREVEVITYELRTEIPT